MKARVIKDGKAIVSSKGQVVIPKSIREAVGVHAGNELVFSVRTDGVIEMRLRKRLIKIFFGRCKQKGKKAMSIEDMDKAIEKAVSEKNDIYRKGKK